MNVIAMLKGRINPRAAMLGFLALGGAIGYVVHAARADGVPPTGALVYSGVVTNAANMPLAGAVEVTIFSDDSGSASPCPPASGTSDTNGRFEVTMPDACATAVANDNTLYVEVKVAGNSVGRQPIGAVPYAIEANNAAHANVADTANQAATAQNANNAAQLEGSPKSAFALTSHSHPAGDLTGTLSTDRYSAYGDLGAEGVLDNNAGTDLLMRSQQDTRYAFTSHAHAGTDITSGTLSTDRYSAYGDLGVEGVLDNNAGTDLLTRGQQDVRYASMSHDHAGTDITSGTLGTDRYSAYGDLGVEGILNNDAATDLLTRAQLDGRYPLTTSLPRITAWTTFTPTLRLDSGTEVTTGINQAFNTGMWRRVGDTIEVMITTNFAGDEPGANHVLWDVPGGHTPLRPGNNSYVLGSAIAWSAGSVATTCAPEVEAGTGSMVFVYCNGIGAIPRNRLGAGAGDWATVTLQYRTPITGWTLTTPATP